MNLLNDCRTSDYEYYKRDGEAEERARRMDPHGELPDVNSAMKAFADAMESKNADEKLVCEACNYGCKRRFLLDAPNPFDPGNRIFGCPGCKSVNTMRSCCDEPGCWEPDTCGTLTPGGHRRTCGKHQPADTPPTAAGKGEG
jgi:hypothetical protein